MLDFYPKSVASAGGHPNIVADAIVAAADDPTTPVHMVVGEDAIGFVISSPVSVPTKHGSQSANRSPKASPDQDLHKHQRHRHRHDAGLVTSCPEPPSDRNVIVRDRFGLGVCWGTFGPDRYRHILG